MSIKFTRLKHWKQTALKMYHLEGKNYTEIHKALGVPYDTVYGALRKLNEYFDADSVKSNMRLPTIFVIGDTQCKQGIDLDYMKWIGYYIARKRPDIIIHIGDHYDMAALSSYDKASLKAEGRRIIEDIRAGDLGLELIEKEIAKVQGYKPRKIITLGNHEERIDRFVGLNPEFEGFMGTDQLAFEKYGWEVIPFLAPCDVEGISFQHYVQNVMTGKPLGGTALNILKSSCKSFVMGHKQVLDIAIKPTLGGGHQIGIVVGACYLHDEGYKGVQGNNHFRGCVMLTEVHNGYALPSPVSLDYMRKVYEANH